MNVLLIGSGGREHALAESILGNPRVTKLYAAPGNGGLAACGECVPVAACDQAGMLALCREKQIGFAVVAPDDPLVGGMADALSAAGVPCFGPTRAAAALEGSKIFAKEFMARHGIPTARHAAFSDAASALAYLATAPVPVVVKADGCALGKGVTVCATREEAAAAVREAMEERKFGAAGARILLEECLEGPEVSVLAFTDGETVRPMVSSMDHKRAYDGDRGPNTGGMGAIAPNPFYTEAIARRAMDEIFLPTVRGMAEEGHPFRGCLYFGLMLTADGPKVIEYNCRFGDPETQVVLPLLESDLFDILLACAEGRLAQTPVRFSTDAAACVVLASGGYPGNVQKGFPISGLAEAARHAHVFHAGTKRLDDGTLVTSGGRVLGLTARAPTLPAALEKAYAAAECVSFEGMRFRRDIGEKALAALAEGSAK
ncbi:MAG: phosphoribosylamine--glycine ligase [Kiritimatiellae bacterium]|nr:phosphoribosylamine--glycine ligase [Kiritimatiellia bacterium]